VISIGAVVLSGMVLLLIGLCTALIWTWFAAIAPPEPAPPPVARPVDRDPVGRDPVATRPPPPPPVPVPAVEPAPVVPPLATGETVVFPGSFPFDAVFPTELDTAAIELLARRLADCPEVGIVGHTDGIGPPDANDRIGRARAEVVAEALVAAGLARERFATDSHVGTVRKVVVSCGRPPQTDDVGAGAHPAVPAREHQQAPE
jgi:hypothetical protein